MAARVVAVLLWLGRRPHLLPAADFAVVSSSADARQGSAAAGRNRRDLIPEPAACRVAVERGSVRKACPGLSQAEPVADMSLAACVPAGEHHVDRCADPDALCRCLLGVIRQSPPPRPTRPGSCVAQRCWCSASARHTFAQLPIAGLPVAFSYMGDHMISDLAREVSGLLQVSPCTRARWIEFGPPIREPINIDRNRPSGAMEPGAPIRERA